MQLIPLSEEQKIEAKERAKELVIRSIGEEPKLEDYQSSHISEYPQWLNRGLLILTVIFALIVFMPSLFRIFTLGYASFIQGINVEYQATIAGLSLVLTAEFAVILSGLLRETLVKGRRQQALLWLATLIGLGITLLGNITIVNPHTVIEWLEALSSPVMVLVSAMSFERILLQSLLERRRSVKAFIEAHKQYELDTREPETHYSFRRFWASSLREALIEENSKGRGQKERLELMSQMTPDDWKQLILAHMIEDDWSSEPVNFTQGSDNQSHYNPQSSNTYQSLNGAKAKE